MIDNKIIKRYYEFGSSNLSDMGFEYYKNEKYGFAACCFLKAAETEKNPEIKSRYFLYAADCWIHIGNSGIYPIMAAEMSSWAYDFDMNSEASIFLKASAEKLSGNAENSFHLLLRLWNNTSYKGMKIKILPELLNLSSCIHMQLPDIFIDEIIEFCERNYDDFDNVSLNTIMEFILPKKKTDILGFSKIIEYAENHLDKINSFYTFSDHNINFKDITAIYRKPTFMECADIMFFSVESLKKDLIDADLSLNEYKYIITFHSIDFLYYLKSLNYKFLFEYGGFDFYIILNK